MKNRIVSLTKVNGDHETRVIFRASDLLCLEEEYSEKGLVVRVTLKSRTSHEQAFIIKEPLVDAYKFCYGATLPKTSGSQEVR